MPPIISNVPSITFYSSTVSKFVKMAWSVLRLRDFLPAVKIISDGMVNEGVSKQMPFLNIKMVKKIY